MTPQVPKANGGLSLADRVRGRVSMSAGRANLASSWRVPVADPDQSTPSKGVERGQRISDSERQVCIFSQLQNGPGSYAPLLFCSLAIKERRRSALAQPDMFFGEAIPGIGTQLFGFWYTDGKSSAQPCLTV
jgi:hypothetical protein